MENESKNDLPIDKSAQLKQEKAEIDKDLDESDKAYQLATIKFKNYNDTLDSVQAVYCRGLFGSFESINVGYMDRNATMAKIRDEINELDKNDPKSELKEMELEQKRRDTEKEFTDNVGLVFQDPAILTNQQRAEYNTLLGLRNDSLRACKDTAEKHLENVTKLIECNEKITALESTETTSTEDIDASSDMPSYTNPED